MMPSLFLKEIATKAGNFGRMLTGILHKKGWPANPESKINPKLLTSQS
jgi:hypothetical protein